MDGNNKLYIRSTKYESSALCPVQKAYWCCSSGRALQSYRGRRVAGNVNFQNKNVYFWRNTIEILNTTTLNKTRLKKQHNNIFARWYLLITSLNARHKKSVRVKQNLNYTQTFYLFLSTTFSRQIFSPSNKYVATDFRDGSKIRRVF